MKMKKELLAPAGDLEAGYAAIFYGADAVYLGLKHFSARATATNFDENELNEFVGFAHSKGKKIYAAINTLVEENELSELISSLDICSRCHVDAVILQDMGVARIIKQKYPELELHASTQMAVHNKQGALALQKLGFSRVVLARELSLAEIKDIASIPGLETEAFIHGALCYSYSGLCLFSSLECGRSANRGKCLYPCRSEFEGESGKKHYFSMKDMALKEDILKMPVTSLKIEGRKKNALYVAAVTDYYRRILDGKGADSIREENIKQIFSRPWSEFHLHGKDKSVVDRDFVGHRGLPIGKIEQVFTGKITLHLKHDIARHDGIQIDVAGDEKPFGFSLQGMTVKKKNVFEAKAGEEVVIMLPPKAPRLEKGMTVYLASSSKVKGSYDYQRPKQGEFYQRLPLKVKVTVEENKISAEAGGVLVTVAGEFSKANDIAKINEAIKTAFAKTGDTVFELTDIKIENKQGLFVPMSVLNGLRRDLYSQIKPVHNVGELPQTGEPYVVKNQIWAIKTDDLTCLQNINLEEVDEIVYLLSPEADLEKLRDYPKNKIRLALPALERAPLKYAELVRKLLSGGYKKWEIGNWWGLEMLPEHGLDLSFDGSIYMLNTQAIQAAKEMGANRVTLSVEDCLTNMQTLAEVSPLPLCLPVYQDTPLFTSAVCIRANACKDCPKGEKWLKLRHEGKEYLALSKNCQTMLFAGKPLCFAREAKDVKAACYRVDFVYRHYTPTLVAEIWQKVRHFEDVESCSKANLISGGNF